MEKQQWLIGGAVALMVAAVAFVTHDAPRAAPDYLRAVYGPLHFQPAAEKATDAQCLACHGEILADKARPVSIAGAKAADALAGYQRLSTYRGEQETFHRRHLVTPYARQVMDLHCNTCHQGHDPRDEAQGSSATTPGQNDTAFTLRKQVNVETTCLKCHGQMPWKNMNLPAPWPEIRQVFGNSCTKNCHEAIRTERHNVNYLKAAAIEAAGRENADVCYGCHGGRAWYRISYPYPRHPWPGMPGATPEWAKDRPTESEDRFQSGPVARKFKP